MDGSHRVPQRALASCPVSLQPRLAELTCTTSDLNGLARDLSATKPIYDWNGPRRLALRAELDAAFMHVFRLGRTEVEHILDLFPIVERKDQERFGERRTKRLVLENYDAMAATNGEAVSRGVTDRDTSRETPSAGHVPP